MGGAALDSGAGRGGGTLCASDARCVRLGVGLVGRAGTLARPHGSLGGEGVSAARAMYLGRSGVRVTGARRLLGACQPPAPCARSEGLPRVAVALLLLS